MKNNRMKCVFNYKLDELIVRKYLHMYIEKKYPMSRENNLINEKMLRYLYKKDSVVIKQNVSTIIKNRIESEVPFMYGRLGKTEAIITGQYLEKKYGWRDSYQKEQKDWLCRVAGFFGEEERLEEDIDRYAQLTLDAIGSCDLFACWHPCYVDYLAKHFTSEDALLVEYDVQTGFAIPETDNHWTQALKGKKVLVITAFDESVKHQYYRKDELCINKERTLPEFELLTYKTLVTQCGNGTNGFSDWFEAYDYMKSQILSIDFDIALVGAGAYGFPLSAEIKKSGRQVVELCGAVVLPFGIYGSRDIKLGRYSKYCTDAWIRPLEQPPKNYKKVESGAYW